MTNQRWIWVAVAGLGLLALACGSTGTAPNALGTYATSTTLPVTSEAAQSTIEAAQVEQYLEIIQAERQQREVQATLDLLHAAQTATAQVEAAQATATQIAQQATATQQAQQATATVWAVTVQAEAAAATATQHAAAVQATATQAMVSERATATQQAVSATATVAAQQTTATAQAAATTSAYAVQATATIAAHESALRAERLKREQLNTRRAELVQPLKAYGPWALLIVVVVLLGWALWRFAAVFADRQRVVETGTGLVLVLGNKNNKTQLPQNHWGPVLDVEQPLSLPSPAQQDEVTRRAQTVQALKAAASTEGRGRSNPSQVNRLLNQGHKTAPPATLRLGRVQSVRKLNHAEQAGLVAPQLTTAIEADWKKNVIEGQYREVEND